jgi:hypothetical protein
MMAGASETTDYHLKKMFAAVQHPEQYIRLQPKNFGNAHQDMDNASEKNIRALIEVGTETAENCYEEIKKIAAILVQEGPDPVAFGQPVPMRDTIVI